MPDHPTFDHKGFRQELKALGLSDTAAAHMLGCSATQVRRMKQDPAEADQARPVRPATARLLQAYIDGYRPKDWPL